MRLPLRKPYRAFEEFDALSDQECELMVVRARVQRPVVTGCVPVVGGVCAAGVWCVVIPILYVRGSLPAALAPGDPAVALVVFLCTLPVVGIVATLAMRDAMLRVVLRREVQRARCPKCRQSLVGLRVEYTGLDPHAPGATWVRCPECGRKWVLMDIGLTARELVPWEQRGVPEDFGKKR